jgi:hypothetical protein
MAFVTGTLSVLAAGLAATSEATDSTMGSLTGSPKLEDLGLDI